MNIIAHSFTAMPLFIMGYPYAALGAVVPDITWLYNEYRYLRSPYNNWHYWSRKHLKESDCIFYRIAHSALIVIPICLYFEWYQFMFGWMIHIALDLPSHWGLMQQRPLYPFSYKWKYVFRRYKCE